MTVLVTGLRAAIAPRPGNPVAADIAGAANSPLLRPNLRRVSTVPVENVLAAASAADHGNRLRRLRRRWTVVAGEGPVPPAGVEISAPVPAMGGMEHAAEGAADAPAAVDLVATSTRTLISALRPPL